MDDKKAALLRYILYMLSQNPNMYETLRNLCQEGCQGLVRIGPGVDVDDNSCVYFCNCRRCRKGRGLSPLRIRLRESDEHDRARGRRRSKSKSKSKRRRSRSRKGKRQSRRRR